MFSLGSQGVRLCDGLTRREWLRIGGLGPLGLCLPDLLRLRASAGEGPPSDASSFGRAKHCVLCFLFGAPAAYPAATPVTPEDLAATIYHALGITPTTTLHDLLGRPYTLTAGMPLTSLWT